MFGLHLTRCKISQQYSWKLCQCLCSLHQHLQEAAIRARQQQVDYNQSVGRAAKDVARQVVAGLKAEREELVASNQQKRQTVVDQRGNVAVGQRVRLMRTHKCIYTPIYRIYQHHRGHDAGPKIVMYRDYTSSCSCLKTPTIHIE